MNRLTQKEIVYNHLLEKGHISTIECYDNYKITDLQHAIYELRKEGIVISDKWEKPKEQLGYARKYKRYFLEGGR